MDVFYNNLETVAADLIAITETGCNESIEDAEIIPQGYQILRCDRMDGRKQGGAFLVATHGFELRKVTVPGDVNVDRCAFELICATVHTRNRYLFLCCVVYIPPSSCENDYMILFRMIEQLCVKYRDIVVIGDFNLHSCNNNVINCYEYFLSFCEFIQTNHVPNCKNRQLDLVLCSLSVGNVRVSAADDALVPVDPYHPPLVISVPKGKCARSDTKPTDHPRPDHGVTESSDLWPQWSFAKADYDLLYSLILSIDWGSMYDIHDPEAAVIFFYNTLNNIIDSCVPRKRKRCVTSRYRYPEWYTGEIIHHIRKKAMLHKRFKKSGVSSDYEMFARCRATVKTMIVHAHNQHLEWIQQHFTKDPRSFWDYVRSKKATGNRKNIIKDGNILSDSECAKEFAQYFYSVYNSQQPRLDVNAAVASSGGNSSCVHIGCLALSQVTDALTRLKPKRSAGPDGIPAFVFRDCRAVLAKPLLHLYNLCIESSYFPETWKITRVIPIPKGGMDSDVSGYRPVAILSTPAKVFESTIQKCILDQVSSTLSDAQHGFRPACSTTSNLLNFMMYVVPNVDAGVQVDAAYFDFKKAFDLVDNDILLEKLAAIGCTPKLLQFFANYMRDRRQFVEYAGCKSELYYTRSGVSQGSNVGPLSFIIMINDLPEAVRVATCLLFADDLKLLMVIKDKSDCARLQQDIDYVAEWSRKNKLQFNVKKCSVITFSRMREPHHHEYKLEGTSIERVEKVRDLGVRLNTELTFRDHIVNVCKKSYRSLGFVLRRASGFTNIKAVAALYNALIRTQLEYNAVIWTPHETKYSLMLERIQNKFTRFLYLKLYGVYPFFPLMYPTLFVIGMVGYNKLETRRDLAMATYVFKLLRGKTCNSGVLKEIRLNVPDNYVSRRRKPRLIAVPRARTNLLGKAPLTRALHALNDTADRIDLFSCSLNEFTKTILYVLCYLR